jgi:hypothetical protein
MQSNIDERGALYRRVWGGMNLVVAVLVAALALWSGIWWLWVVVGVGGVAGVFALYEAQKKWCVLRAMGVKTKV